MNTIIKLNDINKIYKDKSVLKGITLNFEKGRIYGLIGENGAGKSTLLKIITGLVKKDSGIVTINSEEINELSSEYLRGFGVIIESPTFYKGLTVYENLEIYCRYMGYYDFQDIDKLLEHFGIQEYRNYKIKKLSDGLKQRLGVIRAVVTKPEVLILDEPINYIDPLTIKLVRDYLLKLNRENGTTIILSSHILKEVEAMVDEVIFIKEGRIVEEISIDELQSKCGDYFYIKVDKAEKTLALLEREFKIKDYKLIDDETVRVKLNNIDSSKVIKTLMDKEVKVKEFRSEKVSLEDYYVDIAHGGR